MDWVTPNHDVAPNRAAILVFRDTSPLQAPRQVNAVVRRRKVSMPMSFTINDTDFKIDGAKSRYSLKVLKSGDAVIEAEIYGEKEQYEKITEDYDSSQWSWTLYPPHFYMRSYPAKKHGSAGAFKAAVSQVDLDEYEVAIYLIEHNDVDEVKVKADAKTYEAAGTVFLSGKPHPFSIKYSKREPPACGPLR